MQTWESEESAQHDTKKTDALGSGDRQLPEPDARLLSKADAGKLSIQERRKLSETAGLLAPREEEPQQEPQQQMPVMWCTS